MERRIRIVSLVAVMVVLFSPPPGPRCAPCCWMLRVDPPPAGASLCMLRSLGLWPVVRVIPSGGGLSRR
ncbi:MAG: hypothetical protein Q9Q40_04240 [Acidobacteriota bacterium]|nr:hypothetical protein [Acidobacteriota bacterium]MDQ7088175.1 hypothetical protein [Acidobacteriota bacterium]